MTQAKLITIEPGDLLEQAFQMKHDGYRLVQICSVRTKEGYELTYSFGKELELVNVRIEVPENAEVMSISHIFEPAFLYENEIVDLFGVNIKLITVDYKGKLYRISTETPFK
jgi:ech hydrogenase subunit D